MGKNNPKRQKNKQVLQSLLRQARETTGILQADLSKKLGRSQGFVSKYELGDRRLDLLDLADICDALNISLFELVKEFDHARKSR